MLFKFNGGGQWGGVGGWCPSFLIKSFSPVTRSAFIYMPQSLVQRPGGFDNPGDSQWFWWLVITARWIYLLVLKAFTPTAFIWVKEMTWLYGLGTEPQREERLRRLGQTHKLLCFCQASSAPTVMTTAIHSHEFRISQFSTPILAWDQSSNAHCLSGRRRWWGG